MMVDGAFYDQAHRLTMCISLRCGAPKKWAKKPRQLVVSIVNKRSIADMRRKPPIEAIIWLDNVWTIIPIIIIITMSDVVMMLDNAVRATITSLDLFSQNVFASSLYRNTRRCEPSKRGNRCSNHVSAFIDVVKSVCRMLPAKRFTFAKNVTMVACVGDVRAPRRMKHVA